MRSTERRPPSTLRMEPIMKLSLLACLAFAATFAGALTAGCAADSESPTESELGLAKAAAKPGETGGVCGGAFGPCKNTKDFCNDPSCGTGIGAGKCEAKPKACPADKLLGIFGCDKKQYGNSCLAHAAGTSVTSVQACVFSCGTQNHAGSYVPKPTPAEIADADNFAIDYRWQTSCGTKIICTVPEGD
jgi:hypothetical protein